MQSPFAWNPCDSQLGFKYFMHLVFAGFFKVMANFVVCFCDTRDWTERWAHG